jgi:hypothetical protein
VELDKPQLSYIADHRMKHAMVKLLKEVVSAGEHQTSTLENALFVARTLSELPFELNLWQAQNIWYDGYRRLHDAAKQAASVLSSSTGESGPEAEARRAAAWEDKFKEIGQLMGISVDELVIEEQPPAHEPASQV